MTDRHSSVSGGGGAFTVPVEEYVQGHRDRRSRGVFRCYTLVQSGGPEMGLLFTSLFTAANHSCHLFPHHSLPYVAWLLLFLLLLQQCPGLIAAGLGFFRHCQPMRGHLLCDSYAICLSHLCIWLFASPVFLGGFLPHAFAATLSFELPQNEHLRS